jgi:hypothetical protein
MYKRFQQFISVAMALLVLISTLSVSIEKHYCGDHLVDVAFFTEAQKCGMEASDTDTLLTKNSCCKDVIDLLEGQDELNSEKTKDLNTNQKVFIMSFASVFSGLNLLEPQINAQFEHYSPPKVVQDIQILNEVFLI